MARRATVPPSSVTLSTAFSIALRNLGAPLIVAGSVQDIDEQTLVLDAFVDFLKWNPEAVLMLAPRYPEQHERRKLLEEMLMKRQLIHAYRSTDPVTWPEKTRVLILDTMGELRDFYTLASIAYVGRNHSVLEPLLHTKPVFVTSGWEARYPSYPAMCYMIDQNLVFKIDSPTMLCANWQSTLLTPRDDLEEAIDTALERLAGASDRTLEILLNCRPFIEFAYDT